MRAYIADTECTGIDPDTDQVIELAVMDLPDTVEAFLKAKIEGLPMEHSYFGHTAPMKFGALNTHHISPDRLKGLEPFGGQLATTLFQKRHERASTGRLQAFDDDLVFG